MIPEQTLKALIRVGHIARQAGLVAQSKRFFEHLRDAYPLKAFPYAGIGLACIKTGQYAQAYAAFEQARQFDEGNSDIHLWCGICHFHCGRFAASAKIFQDIMAKPPSIDAIGFTKLAQVMLGSPQLSAFRRNTIPPSL
jgi:tetratricopeptide (TPR) repeat protein